MPTQSALFELPPPWPPCPPVQLSSFTVVAAQAQQPVYMTSPPHLSRHTLARKHSLVSHEAPPLPPVAPLPPLLVPPVPLPAVVLLPAWPFPALLLALPPDIWPAPPAFPSEPITLPSSPQAAKRTGPPTSSNETVRLSGVFL
jgi:hypothetical protein